ncbi:MAG: hypothetical protein RIA64_10045 [Rhodospirillales bacterium]
MVESECDELREEMFDWPKVSDEPFPQGPSLFETYIPKNPNERGYHLTVGYKLAADLLVDQTEKEPWLRSKLVFPIIFCYRHYIELTLKDILQNYGVLGSLEPNTATHDLKSLWHDFRALIDQINDSGPDDISSSVVERWVMEFAKIDPSSQVFRYPTNNIGVPFSEGHESVDLLNLHMIMLKMDTYFGCVGMWLHSLDNIDQGY